MIGSALPGMGWHPLEALSSTLLFWPWPMTWKAVIQVRLVSHRLPRRQLQSPQRRPRRRALKDPPPSPLLLAAPQIHHLLLPLVVFVALCNRLLLQLAHSLVLNPIQHLPLVWEEGQLVLLPVLSLVSWYWLGGSFICGTWLSFREKVTVGQL